MAANGEEENGMMLDMLGDWVKITFEWKGPASAETVLVAGDFNSWATQGPTTLTLSPPGGTTRTGSIRLVEGYYRYKFVVDGVYEADKKHNFQEDYGLRNSVILVGHSNVKRATIESGTLLTYPTLSVAGKTEVGAAISVPPEAVLPDGASAAAGFEPRPVFVYLPPSARRGRVPDSPLPVLYATDGQYLFGPNGYYLHSRAESLWASGEAREFVIVGIPSLLVKRKQELVPRDFGVPSDMLVYIMSAVKPYIEETFPVSTDPKDTGLLGASFGGLTALTAAFHARSTFGRIAAISPSTWFVDVNVRSAAATAIDSWAGYAAGVDDSFPTLFLSAGTAADDQAQLYETQGLVSTVISEIPTLIERIIFHEHIGAAHSEAWWGKLSPTYLRVLFPPEDH